MSRPLRHLVPRNVVLRDHTQAAHLCLRDECADVTPCVEAFVEPAGEVARQLREGLERLREGLERLREGLERLQGLLGQYI